MNLGCLLCTLAASILNAAAIHDSLCHTGYVPEYMLLCTTMPGYVPVWQHMLSPIRVPRDVPSTHMLVIEPLGSTAFAIMACLCQVAKTIQQCIEPYKQFSSSLG